MGNANSVMSSSLANRSWIYLRSWARPCYIYSCSKSPIMWTGSFLHATHGAALFVMCSIKLLLLFSHLNINARVVCVRERERERQTQATPKWNSHGHPSVKIPNWLFDFISTVFALTQPHVCVKLCVFAWDKQRETSKSTPNSPTKERSSYKVKIPAVTSYPAWLSLDHC